MWPNLVPPPVDYFIIKSHYLSCTKLYYYPLFPLGVKSSPMPIFLFSLPLFTEIEISPGSFHYHRPLLTLSPPHPNPTPKSNLPDVTCDTESKLDN